MATPTGFETVTITSVEPSQVEAGVRAESALLGEVLLQLPIARFFVDLFDVARPRARGDTQNLEQSAGRTQLSDLLRRAGQILSVAA